jgi:ribokinase
MSDVFVLGSINQDFVLKVERRPEPGETVTNAELSTHNGGKGANQAAAAALLGTSVTMLGRVGDDEFGGPLVQALREKGIDTSLVERASGKSTGAAFITVTPDGENAITVAPGANRSLTPGDVEAAAEAIGDARVFVAQMEVPVQTVLRAVEVAAEEGTRALVNLAPTFEVPRDLLEKLDPLVVNEHEAAFLLGREVEGVKGALSAAPELLSSGPRSAVITIGEEGAVLADGESVEHLPAPEVDVASLQEAVAYAVRAGAAAVTKEGAQGALPTPEVVEAL